MKRILIVYPDMSVGGSTTSLLGILNNIDYEKYSIDLLLYRNSGDFFNHLPKNVKILPQACKVNSVYDERMMKIFSPKSLFMRIKAGHAARKLKRPIVKSQIMCYENARHSRRIDDEYDIAVAFLEGWPCDYVSKYINAKNKIAWIHVDYLAAGFEPEYDRKMFREFKKIVCVSDKCVEVFQSCFPDMKERVVAIENISSPEMIKELSKQKIPDLQLDPEKINLVTVCRINFTHKGLDRGVEAFKKLRDIDRINNLCWYIIGDGDDEIALANMVRKYDLDDRIVLLKMKINPFPYVVNMDAFFLPSRYEGKPMAVTEALILGIPVIVTNYASAQTQVNNGVTGIILENSSDGVYTSLKELANGEKLKEIRNNLRTFEVVFDKEIKEIYDIFENDRERNG